MFSGGEVGELFRVCQQEALAGFHLGRRPADCLQLEVRCCPHRVLRAFGDVPLAGLCHCP